MDQSRIMIAVDAGQIDALLAEVRALRQDMAAVRMTPAPEWLALPDYAARVGRSPKTVRNWIAAGRLDSRRENGVLMVRSV